MKYKKRKQIYALVTISMIIIAAILVSIVIKKPSITGKAVLNQENIHAENLNLKKNENDTYEWKVNDPGDIKSLKASGSVSSSGTAKVYIEKNGTRYLLFDSTKQLFDVEVHVLPEYKKILQGDEILMQINLLNLRGFGSGNVNVKYSIKDSKGNLFATENETVFIETSSKFVRKLVIPIELKPGTYVVFVEVSSDVIIGTGSDSFEVTSKYEIKYSPELKYYLIVVAAIFAFAIIIIIGLYSLNILKRKKHISELKGSTLQEKIDKLEKELKALEEARKSGFISEESFQKEKKRIEERLGVSKR